MNTIRTQLQFEKNQIYKVFCGAEFGFSRIFILFLILFNIHSCEINNLTKDVVTLRKNIKGLIECNKLTIDIIKKQDSLIVYGIKNKTIKQ